jgi:glycerophosphoryl diester phosphodiesterase
MQTKIFAHRGASKYAPENTMPAFELACQMKADGIETDVQLSKDGIPVLIHDEDLKRTTDGYGLVKDYDFNDLQTLDAGSYFSKKFRGTRLISLYELLNWAKNKPLYLNLELKNNKIEYKDIEKIVLDAVYRYQLDDRTIISSFNPKSVRRLRELNETIDVSLLRGKEHRDPVTYAKDLGASSLHVKYTLLNDSLLRAAEISGMPVRIYTVNRRNALCRYIEKHPAGIITDVPDKALIVRQRIQDW